MILQSKVEKEIYNDSLKKEQLIMKKEKQLNMLKESYFETKALLEKLSEGIATDKDIQIAELVHWHNTLEEFLSEFS